jgi:hypothetical protein
MMSNAKAFKRASCPFESSVIALALLKVVLFYEACNFRQAFFSGGFLWADIPPAAG